jgi:YD repeat-containing protein
MATRDQFVSRDRFDGFDQLVEHQYPDGSVVGFQYDLLGRILSIPGIVESTEYHPDGVLKRRVFSDGSNEVVDEDAQGRANRMRFALGNGEIVEDIERRFTAGSRIDSIVDHRSAETAEHSRAETFRYDALGRVVEESGVWGFLRHEFDDDSRILSTTSSIASLNLGTYEYGRLDGPQPHGVLRIGSESRRYDLDGNTVQIGARIARWTASNKLAEVALPDGRSLSTWYDAEGMLKIERLDGQQTVHLSQFEEVRDGTLVRRVTIGDAVIWESYPGAIARVGASCSTTSGASWLLPLALLMAIAASLRNRVRGTTSALSILLILAIGTCAPPAAALRRRDGMVVVRDFHGSPIAWLGSGTETARLSRLASGHIRWKDFRSFAVRPSFGAGNPQRDDRFSFAGPRVLNLAASCWLSPAAASIEGSTEAPYTYSDGEPAGFVDDSGEDRIITVTHQRQQYSFGTNRGDAHGRTRQNPNDPAGSINVFFAGPHADRARFVQFVSSSLELTVILPGSRTATTRYATGDVRIANLGQPTTIDLTTDPRRPVWTRDPMPPAWTIFYPNEKQVLADGRRFVGMIDAPGVPMGGLDDAIRDTRQLLPPGTRILGGTYRMRAVTYAVIDRQPVASAEWESSVSLSISSVGGVDQMSLSGAGSDGLRIVRGRISEPIVSPSTSIDSAHRAVLPYDVPNVQ